MAFLSDSVAARVVDAFGPLPPARGPALIEASPPVPPRLVELPPPQADCPRGPDQRPGDGPSLQPSLEDSEPLGGPARAQRGRGGRSGEERGSGYGGEQRGIGYGGRDGGGRVQGESGGEVRGEEGERGAGMERQRGREVGSGGVAGREMGPAIEKATARRDEQRRAGGAEQGGEEAARGHAGGDSRWGYQVSKSVAGMSAPPAPPVQERAR